MLNITALAQINRTLYLYTVVSVTDSYTDTVTDTVTVTVTVTVT